MNKGTWIAVGIAVILGGVYLLTIEDPQSTDRSPYTIEQVQDLSRIEIRPPAGDEDPKGGDAGTAEATDDPQTPKDRPSLIAFEKREDGWWLTQPVEAPVGKTTNERLDSVFGNDIGTDDLQIPTDNPGEYKLDESRAVTVSLFAEGESSASAEFEVGEEMTVQKTDAKRTFISPADNEQIYRAQIALGSLVRKKVDEYRSETILSVDRGDVSKIVVDRADGMHIELVKEMPEGGGDEETLPSKRGTWKLKDPVVDWKVSQREVEAAVGVLTELTADDFADDLSPKEAGLEEPSATVRVTEGDETHEILIGVVEPDTTDGEKQAEEPTYYAKLPDEAFIYKLDDYKGDKLDMTLGEIRSKTPRSLPSGRVVRIAFPGDDGVVVGRDEGAWVLERPSADKDFNEKKFTSYEKAALELTVDGFPDVSPGEVGLQRGAEEVEIERKDGSIVRILIGERTEQGGRYVRYSDREEVYTISPSTYDKLTVAVDDIVGELDKKGRGAMPKGMGGAPGAGGGLSPSKKRQLMKQLKQKMGKQ